MKQRMSDADRKHLFGEETTPMPSHSVISQQQRDRDTVPKAEKQEHDELIRYLEHKGWFYHHSRMDKATTSARGIPDFIVGLCGQGVCIEFKLPGRKLTPAQEEWKERATNSRWPYYIFHTAVEAIKMLQSMEQMLQHNLT